jgi:hypothetical protein
MGKLAKKKRQERATLRLKSKPAKENLSENSVPMTYEEAYQATQGFRYSQNALLKQFVEDFDRDHPPGWKKNG